MFLSKKGLSVAEYLANLTSPKVPIDELGLLILARMYHGHVCVVMFDWFWTTGFNLVPMTCEYIFAYAGGVNFLATCNSATVDTMKYSDFLKSVGVSREGQQKAIDLSVQHDDKENKPHRKRKRKNITSENKCSSK